MSDRSNKPSFAVSRNLKHAKYHFIEAITHKLTESSNTKPNSVSTSTWLCVTPNMISTSHKTWQTSLLFLELLQIQNLKRKSGGTSHIMPPHLKKWGDTSPVSPKLRPWTPVNTTRSLRSLRLLQSLRSLRSVRSLRSPRSLISPHQDH